eukprot:s1751_g6.t1
MSTTSDAWGKRLLSLPSQLLRHIAESRALLLLAFLVHAYLWQGGLSAFWHDLTGSAGEVALEDKEGGLHEFPEHLASRMSREANVHPAVLMPFLLSFNMSGEPNSMPEATASILQWLRRMQTFLLLSWLIAIILLLCVHVLGDQASRPLRVMASVSTLKAAILNFYFQGFSARLTDPLVSAWAMLVIAFAQLADGGRASEGSNWAGRWSKKLLLAVLCLSYFLGGCYKLSAAGFSWMDGSVLEFYASLYMSASCLQRSAAAVRLGLCSAEEQAWSRQLFSVLCRVHAWPVLCTCGLLFELTCPLALFHPSLRALMICTAVSFHLGNLFLITLNGDRFLTWIWMLLFVLDFPSTLFNRGAEPPLRLFGTSSWTRSGLGACAEANPPWGSAWRRGRRSSRAFGVVWPSIPERTAARELSAALLACAKARNAATEGAQAVQPAQEACKLRERMGDPKGAALAACEEAKAYHSMKAQAVTRKAALNAVALAKEACDSKTEALAWHCACLAHAAAGQKLDAIKAGRQALALAREVRDVEVIGTALQALMQANGEEEKAASIAEEELMMAKKVGDRRREAYAQLKMAQAMIAQDRPRDALRRATEAAERLKEMGDLKGEAKATQLLVELQCQARRSMEASRTAKEAQRLFKEAGDMKGCVGVLQILTSLHLEAGDPHAAIQAARDQVKLFREAGFKEEEASATLGLAEMTQQTMGPRDALRLAKDAASMFSTAGDLAGQARALAQVAQMHLGLKANTNAMQAAKQAEELARKSGDEKVLISALQAVGEAYSSADRFNEGIDAAKEALQMVEKAPVKEDAARAAALACMANVQLQVAHYDVNNPGARIRPRGLKEAMKAAEEALALHRKLGDRSGEITGIQRIFHAHLLSQDGPNSLRYAREYMELAQATEHKENLGSALVSLCQGHFLCRNWDEAERANLEARAIFEKSRMHENIEVCDQIMREMKQEMERDRRPAQPMGRANAAQGAGQGYNSLLPERQSSRAQQDGVPSGGFRGVPAGGFGSSESTQASPMGFVVPSARVKARAVKAQVPQVRVTGRGHQTAPRITAATAAATLRRAMALEATRHQVQAVAAEVPASVGDRLVMVSPAAHVIAAWEVATLDMEAPEVSLPVASASPECQQVVLAQIKVYRQREGRVCRLVVLAGQRAPRISLGPPAARPSPALPGSEASAAEEKSKLQAASRSVPHEPRGGPQNDQLGAAEAVMAGRSSGILGQAHSEEAATHQLQRWLSQEDAERDAARTVLQRLHATVEVHRQRLVLLLARPPGGGEVAISRAKEVVRDLEAEASTIDLADVSQGGALLPASMRSNHAVLSQSLKETQRQCDSLNREMVQQAESNEKLVESMGGVKAANKRLLEQIRGQSAEIAHMMQQRVADEERLEAAARRHEAQRETARQNLQQQVVSIRDSSTERQWQVQQRLSEKLQKLEYGSVKLRSGLGQLGKDLQERQQTVAELFREVSGWWQVWQKDVPAQLLRPVQKNREEKLALEKRIGRAACTVSLNLGASYGLRVSMSREDLSSEPEDTSPVPHKKRRQEDADAAQPAGPAVQEQTQVPARTIRVRVLSISGETLLTLPRADRCWTMMRLKELVEAALRRPRCTQRLLLQHEDLEKDANQDFRSLAGLLPEGAAELDITLLKQEARPSALYEEAKAGRGGSCLALLQLADNQKLINHVDTASQQSVLHIAAAMRLGAACLGIAANAEFEHVNLIDRRRNWTALHWAVFSNMPDVCTAILSRKDFREGGHRDDSGETALDRAIEAGYRECIFAMVPLLSTKALLSSSLPMPVLINPEDRERIHAVAHGDKDIAEAIQETLAKRKQSEGW